MRQAWAKMIALGMAAAIVFDPVSIRLLAQTPDPEEISYSDSGAARDQERETDSGAVPDDKIIISEFLPLPEDVSRMSVPIGTPFRELVFPTSLKALGSDGEQITVGGVTWSCAQYRLDAGVGEVFPATASLPEEYRLSGDVQPPEIALEMADVGLFAINDRIVVDKVIYKQIDPEQAQLIGVESDFAGGALVIPAEVTDPNDGKVYKVTSIEDSAFKNQYSLYSVSIPDSVRHIAKDAFSGCTKLNQVEFQGTVDTVDDRAFYQTGLTSVKLPRVGKWGNQVFAESQLESIDFGDGVFSGNKMFSYCMKLKEVTIPAVGPNVQELFGDSGVQSAVLGDGVTEVRYAMFSNCRSLASVTLPENLERIDALAFQNCSMLTDITLPDTVQTIDWNAFYGCGFTSLKIPGGITSIGSCAFAECKNLAEVEVAEGVEELGYQIFSGCSSLTTVKLPESLRILGTYVFYQCSSLESINLPEGIADISSLAFAYCTSLKSITLPESLQTINSQAFFRSGLESVEIPANVKEIGSEAFSYCESLTQVDLSEGLETIKGFTFKGCSKLTYIKIPDSVKSLGADTFGWSGITGIQLSKSITVLDNMLFQSCLSLTSVEVPESVTKVYSSVFNGDKELRSIKFLGSLESVAKDTFYGIPEDAKIFVKDLNSAELIRNAGVSPSQLYLLDGDPVIIAPPEFVVDRATYEVLDRTVGSETVQLKIGPATGETFQIPSTVENSGIEYHVTAIGEEAFVSRTFKEIKIPETVTMIGTRAFAASAIESVIIPDSVTKINVQAFFNCTKLSSVKLGGGVTRISDGMFQNCSSLKSIDIPQTVTQIGRSAFTSSGLESLCLPDSLSEISSYAFQACAYLTEVAVPATVSTLGSDVFSSCNNLKTVKLEQGSQMVQVSMFKYCKNLDTVSLPEGLKKIDIDAFYGCESLEKIEIPDSVTSIGSSAFAYCNRLNEVKLSENLVNINYYAFQSCPQLKQIQLPDGLTTICQGIFESSGLTSISLPKNVRTIGNYAFRNCSSLASIDMKDTVVDRIYPEAFLGCSVLKSVELPDSLQTIQARAFQNCYALESVTFGNSLQSIEERAFDGTKLTSIVIPATISYIGDEAFYNCSSLGLAKILGDQLRTIGQRAFPVGTQLVADDPNVQLLLVKYLNQESRPASSWNGMTSVPDGAVVVLEEDADLFGSITIGKDAQVTVLPGKTLTINGTVTLKEGCALTTSGTGAIVVGQYGKVEGGDPDKLPLQYMLLVESGGHGSITADKPYYSPGETAKITVKPDIGYRTYNVYVTGEVQDLDVSPDGTYQLVMPAKPVSVRANFLYALGDIVIEGGDKALEAGETAELTARLPEGLNAPSVSYRWTAEPKSAVILGRTDTEKLTVKADTINADQKVIIKLTASAGTASSTAQKELLVRRVKAESVSVTPEKPFMLSLGEKRPLVASTVPAGLDCTFQWASSNPSVAGVGPDGLVTANAVGTALIRAAADGKESNQVEVRVVAEAIYAVSAELSVKELSLSMGSQRQVTAKLLPENATVWGEWESADPQVAAVDETGTVRGIAPGKTELTFKVKKSKDAYLIQKLPVTVYAGAVTSVTILEKPNGVFHPGDKIQLTARVNPEGLPDKRVLWSSSRPAVAEVDRNGVVTVRGAGVTEIKASSAADPDVFTSVPVSGVIDIEGTLTFQGGGKAAYKYVELTAAWQTPVGAYSDGAGVIRFGSVGVGDYTIKSEPYVSGYNAINRTVSITEGQTGARWSLEYPKCETGTLLLRFQDMAGNAVAGVHASIRSSSPYQYKTGYSGGDGQLTFENLTCDKNGTEFEVSYSTNDGAYGDGKVTLKSAGPARTLDISLPDTSTVSGKVVDTRGYGVAGLFIQLADRGVYTNNDGTFAIRGAIQPGTYPVVFSDKDQYFPVGEQKVTVENGKDIKVPDIVVTRGINVTARLLLDGQTGNYKKAYLTLRDEAGKLMAGGYAAGADGCGFDGAIKKPGVYQLAVTTIYDQQGLNTIRYDAAPYTFTVDNMNQDVIAAELEAHVKLNLSTVFSGEGNALATNTQIIQKGGKFDVIGRYRNNSSQTVTATFETTFTNAQIDGSYAGSEYGNARHVVQLKPGESGRFLLKMLADNTNEHAASVETNVTINGETFDFAKCSVEIANISLATRTTNIGLRQPVQVYGEATSNSRIRIYGEAGELLASTQLTDGMGRWYSEELPGFATEGAHRVYAIAETGQEMAESEPLEIVVSARPVAVERVTVDQLSYEDLPMNTRVGVRTFSHAVDAALRPYPLTVRAYFSNTDQITDVTYHFADCDFQASHGQNADWGADLDGWRGTGIKRLTATVSTRDGRKIEMVIAEVTVLVDPSGYITDADTEEPLPGVEVTCHVKQPGDGSFSIWDGAPVGQQNPLVTGRLGEYGWDVQTGTYMVTAQKDGYEMAESRSIDKYRDGILIPPPALDVNLTMIPTTPMELLSVSAESGEIRARFSRYVRSAQAVVTNQKGETAPVTVQVADDTVTLSGSTLAAGETYTVELSQILPKSGGKPQYSLASVSGTVTMPQRASSGGSSNSSGGGNTKSLIPGIISHMNLSPSAVNKAQRVGDRALLYIGGNPKASGRDLAKAFSALKPGEKLMLRNNNRNAVSYQMVIDPATLTNLPEKLSFGMEVNDLKTKGLFQQYFSNHFAAVSLAQEGGFGFTMELAVKTDLTGLDIGKLSAYRYDPASNTYQLLEDANPWVDVNDYLHLNLSYGGKIVFTDSPIAPK